MTFELPIGIVIYLWLLIVALLIVLICCVTDTIIGLKNYFKRKKENEERMIEDMVGEIINEKINPSGGI